MGPYDPEHEMPDPDRRPGDRWQSDAYRHNAADSRFAYRWSPDRFEERMGGRRDVEREMEMRWRNDARDRDRNPYGGERDAYDRWNNPGGGYRDRERESWRSPMSARQDRSGYDRDRGPYESEPRWRDENDRWSADGWRPEERGGYMTGPHWDRDHGWGSDRGWDHPGGYGRSSRDRDYGRSGWDDPPRRRR